MRAIREASPDERPRPEREDGRRPNGKGACYLGFGALFAAYLVAIGHVGSVARWESGANVFFAGCSLGMVAAGAGAVAVGVLARRRGLAVHSLVGVVAAIVALACAVGGLMRQMQGSSAALSDGAHGAAGVAFGVGCLSLALVWTSAYAALSFVEAFRKGSLSLLWGVALAAVGQWAPSGLPMALCVVVLLALSAVSVVFALQDSAGGQVPAGRREPAGGHAAAEGTGLAEKRAPAGLGTRASAPGACASAGSGAHAFAGEQGRQGADAGLEPLGKRHRLVALLRPSWAALCGLAVCAFLLGLLWAQEAPTHVSGSSSIWGNVGFVGPLIVAGGMACAARRLQGYAEAKRFFWVVMPVVAALFVITPLFDDIGSAGWNALVANLQNGGSAALIVCTWSLLLASARASGLPTGVAFGGCLAFVAGMSLVGFAIHHAVGTAANVVAIIMFVAYLCATVVFLAVDGSEEPMARKQERSIVETYIASRCKAVAETHALTPREAEMLTLLSRGHSYGFIAESAYISEATVRTHARNIYRKIGVSSQEDLLNYIDSL